jgi:hypothetical protein
MCCVGGSGLGPSTETDLVQNKKRLKSPGRRFDPGICWVRKQGTHHYADASVVERIGPRVLLKQKWRSSARTAMAQTHVEHCPGGYDLDGTRERASGVRVAALNQKMAEPMPGVHRSTTAGEVPVG